MLNFGQLAHKVQKNCNISDARYAGDYTLCVFLLKMREYYRWENDIPLTGALPKEDIGEWMQQREQMWAHLESSAFEPIPLEDGSHDPFDSAGINRELIPRGFIYSGGYGRFCKPHFFLGELVKQEKRAGYTIYISSCEYARDLVAPPAMLQGKTIYLRQESVRRFIWEKIEETRWNNNSAMRRALTHYQFDRDAEKALERMTRSETETMLLHELGEGIAGELLGNGWEHMLNGIARSKAEIMARAVRDILADCLSTLPGLVEDRNHPSLHFYFANFAGMRKELFPELSDAYHLWVKSDDIGKLEQLLEAGKSRWLDTAHTMLEIYKTDGNHAEGAIEHLLERKTT